MKIPRTMAKGNRFLGFAKWVATPPNTEASVSVTTSRSRITYMAPQPVSIQNLMVLAALTVVNSQRHVLTKIRFKNFSKNPTSLPKGMLACLETNLPDSMVHLGQAKIIQPR